MDHPALAPRTTPSRHRPGGLLRTTGRATLLVVVALGALTFVGPFLWTITSSLKSWAEIYVFPPTLLPKSWEWHNYPDIFEVAPFHLFIWNTFVIAVLSVLGATVSSSLVGYSFSRFKFPGRDIMFTLCLMTMMLPYEVTLIPTYVLFAKIGWIDSWKPLIVPNYFGGGAFNVFLMRQFFMTLPRDLDESAMIDGAGPFRVFWNVLLPLCVPALMTVIVIGFIGSWHDFMGPLIFLSSEEKMTVSLALDWFRGLAGRITGGYEKPTEHLMMGASTIITIPCILLFIVAQRYFVRGIVMSGFKGAGV